MTEKTFIKWLNRYAEAYMARAMAGSEPTVGAQEETRRWAFSELSRCRDILLKVFRK